ncbi:DUF1353 domain-containing protein [Acinetobacter sp. ANC 4635]|uniref:DUF1353 domain-containing protein n=1 Tax=Acinetobacter sp. ANC 4635 TaxID=2529846 RepID=UPI00103BD29F|nr:DUF1353 domain-containing protein [Acinetobacter sp. ANC 4635]TCB31949.1 DUF1353 domain-containing protein [Acinetobacter sp. ANC 4635]
MFTNKENLKELAKEHFVDGLSHIVIDQIEQDAVAHVEHLPSTISKVGVVPYSLFTVFLSDNFYADLGVGRFTGRLMVCWNGMDEFVFIPDNSHPFSYTSSDGRTITPKLMYTDGGSIPRVLRGLSKFSSWGYAPAFIIHDWLFAAHKCKYAPDTDWDLQSSALILAEAIKTLMEVGYENYEGHQVKLEKGEDTLYLIYLAVKSFIAQDIWDDKKSISCML